MSRETKEYYSERLFLGKEGMVAIRAKAECSIGEPDGTVYPDADMQIVCGEDGVWLSFEANRAGVNKAKLLANVTKRFAAALDWNTEADEGLALQDPVTSCTISLSDNGRFNVTRREGWNLTYIGDAPKEEAYALMGFDRRRDTKPPKCEEPWYYSQETYTAPTLSIYPWYIHTHQDEPPPLHETPNS